MTTTQNTTIRELLDAGNENTLSVQFKSIKLGTMLAKIKATVASLGAVAAVDVTSADVKAAATIAGIALGAGENLPPIGGVISCRVTAGTAAAGDRIITDAGGTPSATVATLSDDGKTLTFEDTLTGFVLEYYPAPAVGLDTLAALATP